MQLVEVVRGEATAEETVQRAVRFVQQIGKLPVIVRDRPGFLVNRILLPYLIAAGELFDTGSSLEDIDGCMLDFGMPMGPLRLIDEVGIDIAADVAGTLAAAFPDRLQIPGILTRMQGRGLMGKKSGAGFYVHRPGREPRPNPVARALRGGLHVQDRASLQSRMVMAMVNEAARCLEERVVGRAEDVDFGMVMGTGWAPFRGGPLRYADSMGADAVVAQLLPLAHLGGALFTPCALLVTMAEQGRKFHEDDSRP
jgi:3-hydroxyacyl-CoA dehydrogenase/enoyl-CoA hydratase/3-hydroxybutyryl-CoA epimerase